MRILVTGVSGQLGYDVVKELWKRGHKAIGSGRRLDEKWLPSDFCVMDITNEDQVLTAVASLKPDAVIHCAAWTAVDAAEEPENRERVWASNVTGAGNLAMACRSCGAKMVYISTDYVFDGQGVKPWSPDCQDFAPLNFYGESKLEGERTVRRQLSRFFIVRTSWVFGANGKNFVKTMIRLGRTHDSLRVVNDQIGSPTYTVDLARLLVDLAESEKYGCYHATNEGYTSWYDFTREIFRQTGIRVDVRPVTTEEYGSSKARRPLNSRLDKRKIQENGFALLPSWEDALHRFLVEIGEITEEMEQ